MSPVTLPATRTMLRRSRESRRKPLAQRNQASRSPESTAHDLPSRGLLRAFPAGPRRLFASIQERKELDYLVCFACSLNLHSLPLHPPLHSLNTDVFILSSTADIFASGDSAQFVAQQWLEKYKVGDADALGDLINCILRCAGCDLEVTVDDIRDPENIPNRLLDLQSVYQEVRLGIAARTNLVGGNKINCLYSNKSSITR